MKIDLNKTNIGTVDIKYREVKTYITGKTVIDADGIMKKVKGKKVLNVYLGDFVDDLINKKITKDSSKKIINSKSEKKLSTLSFLPSDWIKSRKSIDVLLSNLNTANFSGYSIGEDIEDIFLKNPTQCKTTLIRHIDSFINSSDISFDNELFKEYILSIINLNYPNRIDNISETRIAEYNQRLDKYIGTDELKEEVKKKIMLLLDNNHYSEIIALFLLDFIIMQIHLKNKGELENRNNFMYIALIWFDSIETLNFINDSRFTNITSCDTMVFYHYASIFYNAGKFEKSFYIADRIKSNFKNNNKKLVYHYLIKTLYIEHLLLGRGTKKQVAKAFSEISQLYNSIIEKDVLSSEANKLTVLLKEIVNKKYGDVVNSINDISILNTSISKMNKKIKESKLISKLVDLMNFELSKDIERNSTRNKTLVKHCYEFATNLLELNNVENHAQYAKYYLNFVLNQIPENATGDYKTYRKESEEEIKKLQDVPELSFVGINKAEKTIYDKNLNYNNIDKNNTVELYDYNLKTVCYSNDLNNIADNFINSIENCSERKILDKSTENELLSDVLTKHTVVVLFSDDEQKNIKDCLNLIEFISSNTIFNNQAYKNTDVYVRADFDVASIFIDARLNMLNQDEYLRVHICDYNRMSAQKLLIDYPLFTPCLNNKNKNGDTNIDVVVFGTNDSTYKLTKEIIATAYTNNVPSVAIIGDNAELYEGKLRQDAPGIFTERESLHRIRPTYHNYDIEQTDFIQLLLDTNSEFRYKLNVSNYIIIDLGCDTKNIIFATKLRAWLLNIDNKFSHAPFIAVKCENKLYAEAGNNLIVNNKTPGNDIYNNFNLHFYGTKEDIFNSKYLDITKCKEKQMALNTHLCYWGNPTQTEKEAAIRNYFKFSYNRDSSESKSISIMYMFYSSGFVTELTALDNSIDKIIDEIASEFNDWINTNDNVETVSYYEHSRWVGFMLSKGWQSASLEQVKAYAGQKSGDDHKHLLAKLHPFICNWDDFYNSTEEDIKVKELISSIKGLNAPVKSTKNIILNTKYIVHNNPFKTPDNFTER